MEEKDTPYSDAYKKKSEELLKKKNTPENTIQKAEQEIKKDFQATLNYLELPSHIRILKIIALLIPVAIIIYLVYANFIVSQSFTYFYDIGSQPDINKPYLSPLTRISQAVNSSPSYRNLTSGLVYFTIQIPRNSESFEVSTRFMNIFPEDSSFSLGAQDQSNWHYQWKTLYSPLLQNLSGFSTKDSIVYSTNSNPILFSNLNQSKYNIIASNIPFENPEIKLENFSPSSFVISTALRGGHSFYIYVKSSLSLNVSKQDLNWYNGTDELAITLSKQDNIITNVTIPDDGVADASHKLTEIQSISMNQNLSEGVYKLDFSSFDGIITRIQLNTNKIVANQMVFLANNPIYLNISKTPTIIYTINARPSEISFNTYHRQGLQNISINNQSFQITNISQESSVKVNEGETSLIIPENDLILTTPGYFSFSKESYFEPFANRVVSLRNNITWMRENVDYLVINYQPALIDGDWIVAKQTYNISGLYIKNNKLSLVYSIPHLNKEEFQNYTLPVDWINITIHKSGLFTK